MFKISMKNELYFLKLPEHHVEVVDLIEAEDVEVKKDRKRFRGSTSRQSADRFRSQCALVVGFHKKSIQI